jgi:magnesium transporter
MGNQNTSKENVRELQEKLELLLKEDKFRELRKMLVDYFPVDIAEALIEMDNPKYSIVLLRLVPNDTAAEIFTYLSTEMQEDIVQTMNNGEIRDLMSEIFTDDIVDILEEMPSNIVKKILRATTKEDREKINQILKYEDDTAGSIMSVEFIKLREQNTVKDAILKVRQWKELADEFNICYIVDEFNNLKGWIELKELILNEESTPIADVMQHKFVFANTKTDQEEVAEIFKKYDITSLPIVNTQNKLVGIITVDDVIDVIDEEATEDIHKMAGISPTEDAYFKTSVWKMVRSRSVWLLFLMVSATLSQIVITAFMNLYHVSEGTTTTNGTYDITFIVTMLLTPLLTVISGTNGNAGSQASTMVVRAISLREVQTKDFLRVAWKELRVAAICGLILIAVNFVRMEIIWAVSIRDTMFDKVHWFTIATTSIAMYATIIVAKVVGGTLPIIAKAVKMDPAVMAAPLLTTLVDALSTAVFFGVGMAFFANYIL